MNNVIKKSFCLVLVLCLALAFAGCGNNTQDAQEAKAAVTAFMDALVNLDMQKAAEYVDNPDVIEKLGLDDISGMAIDKVLQENPGLEQYKDKFMPIIDKALEKTKAAMSYEILGEENDGNGFVYTINMTAPSNPAAAEEQLQESMAEYTTEAGILKVAQELLESGKITMNSSQDEIINATLDYMMDKIVDALDKMTFETNTEEINVSVSKVNDKWLINTVE